MREVLAVEALASSLRLVELSPTLLCAPLSNIRSTYLNLCWDCDAVVILSKLLRYWMTIKMVLRFNSPNYAVIEFLTISPDKPWWPLDIRCEFVADSFVDVAFLHIVGRHSRCVSFHRSASHSLARRVSTGCVLLAWEIYGIREKAPHISELLGQLVSRIADVNVSCFLVWQPAKV